MGVYRNNALYGAGSKKIDTLLAGGDVSFGEASVNGCPIDVQVGVGGTVKFDAYDGTTDTMTLAAGGHLGVMVRKIYQIGTTATDVHVIF